MATLLHLDSSVFPHDGSVSRDVGASFRKAWEAEHPDGTVVYRDLAADPLPHLDGVAASSAFAPPETHSPEQSVAYALRDKLARELEQADAVLIGAPMYNFTVPSTLKAWIDQVVLNGRTFGTDTPTAAGTPTVVVASRGGGYGPGTPRESWEFVQSYLAKMLGEGMGLELEFVVPELTLAARTPGMESLVDLAEASRTKAHETAGAHGKALAARFAAAV
ncbi:FMN-dependent NADH-azoreductase [Streptomyces abyssalis]|uniref:FMN dependent NADH:quinone oxidoreductase n=1 Tax=Streptomyces abyssalis TaxID=933944 RepID=A0A1E7JPK8_9ACTN|nr:NAD(P)H-dependent oxidoreductase [Streptomyces abyssalis]OEU90222.1 FMN-dependent NADH-azoreductase [Streptomyces abyssalis]OEU94956.1 FMN-dependent NADH-azoreductase [Streptomyces abyssalis]OEV29657.1 FMN-dependent NADH-azoreductase [Streptomyces nanshensis]